LFQDGLLEWIQQKINEKRFASVSVEYALQKLRKEEP